MSQSEAYKRWYASKGKLTLSEKRKQKYKTDPDYRAKCLQRAASVRQAARQRDPLPPEYTWRLGDLCDELGISTATLRHWREEGYFPSPYEHGGRLWFTSPQAKMLKHLASILSGRRKLNEDQQKELTNLVDFIFANWS